MAGKEKRGPPVWAAGAVSGETVDVALVLTDGVEIFDVGEVRQVAYSDADRAVLEAAMGAWPDEPRAQKAVRVVEAAHIAALSGGLPVALVGMDGHTLAHDPTGGRIHQAGDGSAIASALGIEVIWDFRSADMGLGGHGAPVSPFYHWACARWIGARGPLAILIVDDMGAMTWIDPSVEHPEDPGALLAFETGPGIGELMGARWRGALDAMAGQGEIDLTVLQTALEAPWFDIPPPKTLLGDKGSILLDAVAHLREADAAATLMAVAAGAVARGFSHLPTRPQQVLVAGEGRKATPLMAMLTEALACKVAPVEKIGLNGDALEAQAMAYLAVRVARGLPTTAPTTTGVAAAVGGGQRSRPKPKA